MKRIHRFLILCTALIWTLATISATVPGAVAGEDEESALVVFDFGNGTVTHSFVLPGKDMNGLNCTLRAADNLGYRVNYTEGEYGAFVNDIDGLAPDADYTEFWSLLIWNATNSSWDPSPVGASSLEVSPGDSVCWFFGAWGEKSSVAPDDFEYLVEHQEDGVEDEESEGASSLLAPAIGPGAVLSILVAVVIRKRS